VCLALVQTIVPAAADAAVATFTDAAAAAGEEGFDALWEAWADRCDTAYAVWSNPSWRKRMKSFVSAG
jgi:hypothetical protein